MTLLPLKSHLWYSGQWNDISTPTFNRRTVQLRSGVQREGAVADSAQMMLELNDQDKRFNVRHPLSPLFGLLGRNAPLRVSLGTPHVGAVNSDSLDTTDHVAPSVQATEGGMLICCWAAPQPVGVYTVPGSMTGGSVSNIGPFTLRVAREIVPAAGPTGTRTATFSAAEDYVAGSVFIHGPAALSTGSLAFRGRSVTIDGNAGDWWVLMTAFASHPDTDPGLELNPCYFPHSTDGGGWIPLGDTGSVAVGDTEAEHLRMRVWIKRVKTTSATHRITLENTGIAATVNATSFLGTAAAASAVVRIPAAEVEPWSIVGTTAVTTMPPRRDKSGNDRSVPVESSGLMQRLSTNADQPVASPLRKYFSRADADVLAYWPCEDGRDATQLEAVTPGVQPGAVIRDVSPASFDDFAGSQPVPTLGADGHLRFYMPAHQRGSEQHSVLLAVPDDGLPDQQQLYSVRMADGSLFQLRYGTGGSLNLVMLNADNTTLDSTGAVSFAVNGTRFYLQISMVQVGADIDVDILTWKFLGVETEASVSGFGDTFTGRTLSTSVRSRVGVGGNPTGLAAGHVVVTTTPTVVTLALQFALTGFHAEPAAGRIERLCHDAGVPIMFVGDPNLSPKMGPQQTGTLMELVRHAEQVDHGILYDPAEALALAYRTGRSLYNQQAVATLDGAGGDLAEPWAPEPDEFLIRNDVTVSRVDGSAARSVQTSGPLNVGDPAQDPTAAGPYPVQLSLNLMEDAQCAYHASWLRYLGTVDESRIPSVSVDLLKSNAQKPDLLRAVLALDPGDRLVITGRPDDLPDDASQIMLGADASLARDIGLITLNCQPAAPFQVGIYADTAEAPAEDEPKRYAPFDSRVATAFLAGTDTALVVADQTGGNDLWSQTPDLPLDIIVRGVRLRVTAVSAPTGAQQTLTVDQAPVNGVTGVTIEAGEQVELWAPAIYAL